MSERHYEVWSPQMTFGGSYEPPEVGSCWLMVMAPNAKAAISAAVKSPEFKTWVAEARGDRMPPFKGVKARRAVCEHGICWGCGTECRGCLEAAEAGEPAK